MATKVSRPSNDSSKMLAFEIAELDRISPNPEKAASLKALLSSPVDTFRRPYGRSIGAYPRPSIMVSSCNRTDFLNDPTGSRRFWVINLEGKLIIIRF